MIAPAAPVLQGYGFSVQPPPGWEGRLYQRTRPTAPESSRTAIAGAQGWLGEQTLPVVHLANFALPVNRGDFGSGAVELMRRTNAFIALLQFGPECLGSALYESQGLPTVEPSRFNPNGLQRILPGQCGAQYFFTVNGRPMCLYIVLGSQSEVVAMTAQVNKVLELIRVSKQ